MRPFLRTLVGLALLCTGGYVALGGNYPTDSYRFRLSIEVEDSGGRKTASSVLEVKTIVGSCWNPSAPCSQTFVYGQAVALDLSPEPLLVVPLAFGRERLWVDDFQYLVAFAFFGIPEPGTFGADRNIEWTRRLSQISGSRDLTGELTPLLVYFEDINDPKTVQRVSPEDFPRVFGPKVRFTRAWITLTHDPVSTGIERWLPWLKDMHSQLDGSKTQNKPTLANKLGSFNFKGDL
jgi:hypothetical protein